MAHIHGVDVTTRCCPVLAVRRGGTRQGDRAPEEGARRQGGPQARAQDHALRRPAAPQRTRGRRRPRPHDGTIIPGGPNMIWGTDSTVAYTIRDGWVWAFVEITPRRLASRWHPGATGSPPWSRSWTPTGTA